MAGIVATSVLLLGSASSARAASITFNFDCDIVGPTCTNPANAGTLTISDNGSSVDLLLNLTSGDPQSLYINFTGFPLTAGYTFKTSTAGVDVNQGSNNTGDEEQADGYSIGMFDLRLPDGGNLSGNPFSTTLRLTDGTDANPVDLDVAMFNALTSDGKLYAAVNLTGGDSWFGSTSCDGCGVVTTAAVPEPASMLLLGSGLVAGAARLRRRKR